MTATIVIPTPATTPNDLASLRAQQKQIQAQMKALREQAAALRKAKAADKLADVIRQQTEKPNGSMNYTIGAAMRQRMRAGATREEAEAGVLDLCRAIRPAPPTPTTTSRTSRPARRRRWLRTASPPSPQRDGRETCRRDGVSYRRAMRRDIWPSVLPPRRHRRTCA
jgi:hypothetical protein